MTAIEAIYSLHRRHPDLRLKSIVRKIERKKAHYYLWIWWLEDQIGKIVDRECRSDAGADSDVQHEIGQQ